MANIPRIDQDPQNQHFADNNATAARFVAYPDHIAVNDYSKSPMSDHEATLLNGLHNSTHEQIEEELNKPPKFIEGTIAPEKKSRFTRTQQLIALGAGAALVSGAAYFGVSRIVGNSGPDLSNIADKSTSAPGDISAEGVAQEEVDYSKIDVQTLTVEEFYDDNIYPQEYRVQWANEIIKEREQQAYAELNQITISNNLQPLSQLVAPNINNKGQDIVLQHDIIQYIASTAPTADEGKKIMAAYGSYEIVQNIFPAIDKREPITTSTTVPWGAEGPLESPVFSQTAVGDYKPEGKSSILLIKMNDYSNVATQTIEQFVGGRYITVDAKNTSDPDWVIEPRSIRDTQQ